MVLMKYMIGTAVAGVACLAADSMTIDVVVEKNEPFFSQGKPKSMPEPKKEEKPTVYAVIRRDPVEELFSNMDSLPL